VITGSNDQTVRLWDSITYQPIGPPYRLSSKATRVAFSPRDRFIAASGESGEIRVWNIVPPRTETPDRLLLWAQSLTGLTLDRTGGDGIGIIRGLSAADYRRVKQELQRGTPRIHEIEAP
jgi:WD40 repeat protein